MSHLLPATTYMLRVSATNAHGQSPWSDVVSVMTYGLPPSSPEPPRLLKATARSLHLTWGPQSGGSENASKTSSAPSKPILRYMLEMQEGEARQHFKKVFDDDATQFIVEGLRRCSLYRFRLAATNVDGMSHWSEIVAFRTTPDVPTAPKGLRLRGRVRPYNINVCWLSPEDDGGLPVSAYRLEVFMPRLPSPLLRKYSTQPHKKNTHLTQATAVPDDFKVVETMSPICWPWVIGTSTANINRYLHIPNYGLHCTPSLTLAVILTPFLTHPVADLTGFEVTGLSLPRPPLTHPTVCTTSHKFSILWHNNRFPYLFLMVPTT
ncbi:unnamed protein product [Mesocestoides corti]|uniref:Fibronectin type-III domain-containing protein n=1 Tax=Mesocestoides corti TaxID=53468 RepID=A0A3P6HL30_MESCO|nr:unnamed protein product [Mesocestoides corti]